MFFHVTGSGASRGIGLAIALVAAREGANVAILAKTADPHPKLPGTIYSGTCADMLLPMVYATHMTSSKSVCEQD